VPLPDFQLAYYDHLLRLDHSGQWWFEALVSPGRESALERRMHELTGLLDAPRGLPAATPPEPLTLSAQAARAHLAAVQDCRRRIAAGEIFQANICLRLESAWGGTSSELFARALDHGHEALYGACFEAPWGGIASLSPELFLRRTGELVTTGPIKGTVRRSDDPEADDRAMRTLQASAKDAAEHVMIVDLMRNDLGRVCRYGSIVAARVPRLEAHPGVWHLVSDVHGRLAPGAGNGDLLRATFPPGSVTGAPKVQAMKVIAQLERAGRELYTGAIGYASPAAGLELSVAIRTFELRGGALWLGVGGGIVADSDPALELEEALIKARPLAAAVGSGLRR
jgi:para-aminobenzoate synthetase/4-amino-4-deoxychorismate lyase